MKYERHTYISTFLCKSCGVEMKLPRSFTKRREIFHLKTMYCYKCKIETDFIEAEEFKDEIHRKFW